MDSIKTIIARGNAILAVRDDSNSSALSPTMIDLLIALMVLVFVSLCLVGVLYIVRKIRKSRTAKRQQLPQYQDQVRNTSNHRRLTITATPYGQRASSIYVYDEKSPMISNSGSAPQSPSDVPEIRITFPDEHDESGRRKSGRVVVVRVG